MEDKELLLVKGDENYMNQQEFLYLFSEYLILDCNGIEGKLSKN